jgi:SAM-dependent methyltransferase
MTDSLINSEDYQPPGEERLAFARAKPRSVAVGVMYRFIRIGSAVFGKRAMLRLALNASRLFGRFAFELSSETYGERFHNRAMALSEDILRRHIPRNGTALDVGCGQGRACRMAAKFAAAVTGIDYDNSLIDAARRMTSAENVEYVHGDVTRDLGGRRFDLALLIHVIEHIDDADKILSELRSAADKLIVEVPDIESDTLNLVRLDLGQPFYSDGDHVREYTEKILADQLTRNGWTIVETRKNGGAILAVATQSVPL